jgi:hypothetical protein
MTELNPPIPPAHKLRIKKVKKPFYRRTWVLIFAALFTLGLIGNLVDPASNTTSGSSSSNDSSASTDAPAPYTDAEYAAALNNMTIKKDEVVGTRFVHDKTSPTVVNKNAFYIYISQKPGDVGGIRFRVQYAGSDWIFFKKIIVNADGSVFTMDFDFFDVQRDNGMGGVWEWLDINASKKNIEMINSIANSKVATLRLEGDSYHKDRKLTAAEKTALLDVLTVMDGYERGKLPIS